MTPPIVVQPQSHGLLVRALWFVFVGWWLSGLCMIVAWCCAAIIVGLPITFMSINRLPAILTLRSRTTRYDVQAHDDGGITVRERHRKQLPLLLRIVYFPVGLILGAIWMWLGWLLCVTLILLPVGLTMLNRTPFVMTLQRN